MASSYKRKVKIAPEKKPVTALQAGNSRESVKLSKNTIEEYRTWAAASNRSLSQQMERVLQQAFLNFQEGKIAGTVAGLWADTHK